DIYEIGTLASVVRYVTGTDGAHHVICQGESRFRISEVIRETPFLAVRAEVLQEPDDASPEIEARLQSLKSRAVEALTLLPQVPAELVQTIQEVESAGRLADLIASFMDIKPEEKQELLQTVELKDRLDKVLRLLAHRVEVL